MALTTEEEAAIRDLLTGADSFSSLLTSISAIKNHLLSQKVIIDVLKEEINILQQCLTEEENGIYIRKKYSLLERSAEMIGLTDAQKQALREEIETPTELPGDFGTTRLDTGPMPDDLTPQDLGL